MDSKRIKEIYLAGGCFWGMEAFYQQLEGIKKTEVGYANGNGENPSYLFVCSDTSGFAETLYLEYDSEVISLNTILDYFFLVVDPTALNYQKEDRGTQYRNGIYYCDDFDKEEILNYIEKIESSYEKPLVTEILPLKNYYPAEEHHQDYLKKNPEGYCHIDMSILKKNG